MNYSENNEIFVWGCFLATPCRSRVLMKHRTALCMSIVGALTLAYWVNLTHTPAQAAHAFVVSRVARCDHPKQSTPLLNQALLLCWRTIYRDVCCVCSAHDMTCELHHINIYTPLATLARCSWKDWIQAWCDGVPVSAWTGASVPCRPPHPSLWCCSTPSSSTICIPEPSHSALLST